MSETPPLIYIVRDENREGSSSQPVLFKRKKIGGCGKRSREGEGKKIADLKTPITQPEKRKSIDSAAQIVYVLGIVVERCTAEMRNLAKRLGRKVERKQASL